MGKIKIESKRINNIEILENNEDECVVVIELKEDIEYSKKYCINKISIIKEKEQIYIEPCLADKIGVYIKNITTPKANKLIRKYNSEIEEIVTCMNKIQVVF